MLVFYFRVGSSKPTVQSSHGLLCGKWLPAAVQDQILSMDMVLQLGELFLGALPTVILILIFYFILKSLFFKPLLAVMAEREARSIGAQKAAETAQAAAAEKVKQYQEALRQARARSAAEVGAAKERVARELALARQDLEPSVAQLASEIATRVLRPVREAR